MIEPIAYIVACVRKKQIVPAPAKELYVSPWFRAARAYVEATGKPWFILSARHGLVKPDDVLEPYERHISHWGGKADRACWGSREVGRLRFHLPGSKTVAELRGKAISVLAGRDYVDAISQALGLDFGLHVVTPLAGLGIGQQIAWLRANKSSDPSPEVATGSVPPGEGRGVLEAARR